MGEQVLHIVGEPRGLFKVQARRLWADHYRVNLFVGQDAASAKIVNSYFVKVGSDGKILESRPKITKQYETDET